MVLERYEVQLDSGAVASVYGSSGIKLCGTLEGFLEKLSPKVGGGWQKRWFVLDCAAKVRDARQTRSHVNGHTG